MFSTGELMHLHLCCNILLIHVITLTAWLEKQLPFLYDTISHFQSTGDLQCFRSGSLFAATGLAESFLRVVFVETNVWSHVQRKRSRQFLLSWLARHLATCWPLSDINRHILERRRRRRRRRQVSNIKGKGTSPPAMTPHRNQSVMSKNTSAG